MNDDPIELIVDSKLRGAEPRPLVARRKVAVRVHLAGGSTIEGDFYALADPTGTAREPILERLEDPTERFVPIANGSRHVLANKAAILYLESAEVLAASTADGSGAHSFLVEVTLDSGITLEGTIETDVRQTYYRTLDHLNGRPDRFLRLVHASRVRYVSHAHVVSIVDRTD